MLIRWRRFCIFEIHSEPKYFRKLPQELKRHISTQKRNFIEILFRHKFSCMFMFDLRISIKITKQKQNIAPNKKWNLIFICSLPSIQPLKYIFFLQLQQQQITKYFHRNIHMSVLCTQQVKICTYNILWKFARHFFCVYVMHFHMTMCEHFHKFFFM